LSIYTIEQHTGKRRLKLRHKQEMDYRSSVGKVDFILTGTNALPVF